MSKREEIQADALEAIKNNNYRGVLDISPRVGKTKIIIESIRGKSNRKIYIICPRLPLLDNWKREMDKWELDFKPNLLCFGSIKKIPKDTDLVIVDEVHMLSERNFLYLKRLLPKTRILAMSGSIGTDTKKDIERYFGLNVIYKYSFYQAIRDNIISNFQIYTIPCEFDDGIVNIKSGSKKYPKITTEKKHYDYLTKQFEKFRELTLVDYSNKKLKNYYSRQRQFFIYKAPTKLNIASKLIKSISDQCLIFTSSTESADSLNEESFHSKSVNGKSYLDLFGKGDIQRLSVVSMVDVGITLKNLKTIVIHQLQSNSETAIQRILRACNLDDENNIAKIFITYYKDSVDEDWMMSGLEQIDKKHIKEINYEEISNYV